MDEQTIEARISEILSEYSTLPQLEKWDLSLECASKKGDVKVVLTNGKHTIEREIGFKEDLSFIGDTFDYPITFSPRSKMFNLQMVKNAYFNSLGYLEVNHGDSTETFKVSKENKKYISEKLKSLLGDKYNETYRPTEIIAKVVPTHTAELLFKVYFTIGGKRDYLIIAGDTIEKVKATADDVISKRGLNIQDNQIFSERIKNA